MHTYMRARTNTHTHKNNREEFERRDVEGVEVRVHGRDWKGERVIIIFSN